MGCVLLLIRFPCRVGGRDALRGERIEGGGRRQAGVRGCSRDPAHGPERVHLEELVAEGGGGNASDRGVMARKMLGWDMSGQEKQWGRACTALTSLIGMRNQGSAHETEKIGMSRTFGESHRAFPVRGSDAIFQAFNGRTLRFKRSKPALP